MFLPSNKIVVLSSAKKKKNKIKPLHVKNNKSTSKSIGPEAVP